MSKEIKNHGFGALISPSDIRDYPAGSYLPETTATSLDYFMQDDILDITYDQGITQKCVAYSLKQIVERFNKYEYDKYIPMSVDFLFSNREIGQPSFLLLPFEGAYPKDLIQNLYKYGACEDSLCPTRQPDDLDDFINITDEMRAAASKYVIKMYLKVTTDEEIKSALVNGCGVTASIPITPKFIGGYNELITEDYAKKTKIGNHMIVIYGWKKHNGKYYWVCKNSWGDDWGDNGFFYLPFGYVFNEIWALTDKIFPHWSDKYYQYLTVNNGIVFDERGYDLPASRGYVFKYIAKVLGYQGEDVYDNYFNYLNTKTVVHEKRYEDNITRGETFTMLARLKGYQEPTPNIPPHWAQKYYNYLTQECGMAIYETRFNDLIKRSEVITLLARLMGFIEPSGEEAKRI